MAKETAHQIGTPLSAMLGWVAYLKDKYPQEEAFGEMERDVNRLTAITERFSKIGSQPELTHTALTDTIENSLDYLVNRLGKNVTFTSNIASDLQAQHNPQLISWVLENLITNATDALEGKGRNRSRSPIERYGHLHFCQGLRQGHTVKYSTVHL